MLTLVPIHLKAAVRKCVHVFCKIKYFVTALLTVTVNKVSDRCGTIIEKSFGN